MDAYLFIIASFCVIQLIFAHPSFEDFLSDSPWPSLPECTRENDNCDYALKTISSRPTANGGVEREETIYETNTEICTCPGGRTCPRGWDPAPGRTITRTLLSTGKRVEYKLNYCTEITTQTNECDRDEIVATMTGYMVPDTVQTANCTCPGNNFRLHLKRAYFTHPFRVKHEFVCELRPCNMRTMNPGTKRVCKKIKKNEVTEYRCACPDEYECVMQPFARKGYCEPRPRF